MNSKLTENLAQLIKNLVLVFACLYPVHWMNVNLAQTNDTRIAVLSLIGLAFLFGFFAFVAAVKVFVSAALQGSGGAIRCFGGLLRFHAFRRLLFGAIGLSIAIVGSACIPSSNAVWMIVFAILGLIVMKLPDVWACTREQNWFLRIFRSGSAPEAEFAQSYHLKRSSKPFRSTFRRGAGYCADELFIGTSTRESI